MGKHGGWLGAAGLAVGLLIGYVGGQNNAPMPEPINPQLRELNADLWVQTAAEYRACCLQTYRLAGERLREKLGKVRKENAKPVAIVMDLDETVLDNSPFQTWLFRYAVPYSDERWDVWEQGQANEVRLVPGALAFIEAAEKAGVVVVYVSNRTEKHRVGTIEALKHVGISTKDIEGRLLLATTTSDKTARRQQVRDRYDVLMLLGDNLRDFAEGFRADKVDPGDVTGLRGAIGAREAAVDSQKAKWGDEWFILPNPVYGEWTKLLGENPLEVMRPSRMKAP